MAYINYLDLKNIKTMNFQYLTTFPARAKWILDKNTIIIGRVGDINNLKSNNSIIRENIPNLVGSSGFTCFKSKTNYVLNEYLWYCIKRENFFNYIYSKSKGSVYSEVSQSDLLNYQVYIPPISTQQKIIDIIEPIEKLENTFNKLNNTINNFELFLFNSIYNNSSNVSINKLITISKITANSNELELRGVGYSGFVNKSNVNRSKLSKQVLEDEFVIGLISKNIPIGFNWGKNKIGVSTAYYVFKPNKNPLASWYIYYYLKNKNWKQFVKPTSRHGQAFEVNSFLKHNVNFVSKDYLMKRLNFVFNNIKQLKNKHKDILNKIIKVKNKLIKFMII